jgi:Fe-S oxidoreductase
LRGAPERRFSPEATLHPFDEHAAALSTCFPCPKLCRFACPVAEAEGRESVTPWGLATRAEHVRLGRLPLDAGTAEIFHHCTGCGRCTANCRHGVPVPTVVAAVRAEAVRAGLGAAALSAWAALPTGEHPAVRSLPEGGSVLLLPGYAEGESVAAARRLLGAVGLERLGRPVRGALTAGTRWAEAGYPERAEAERLRVLRALEGVTTLVCLDPDDARALAADAPDVVRTLTEVLWARRTALLPRLRRIIEGPVLYLDPCRLGRGLGQYDAPRRLLAPVVGEVVEATMNRAQGGCCGAGGGLPATAPAVAATVAREAVADVEGVPVVLAGAVCAAHVRAAVPEREVFDLAVLLARAL